MRHNCAIYGQLTERDSLREMVFFNHPVLSWKLIKDLTFFFCLDQKLAVTGTNLHHSPFLLLILFSVGVSLGVRGFLLRP